MPPSKDANMCDALQRQDTKLICLNDAFTAQLKKDTAKSTCKWNESD